MLTKQFFPFHQSFVFIYWHVMNTDWQKQSTKRCSIKNVFLKVLRNSLENTCARVSLQAYNFTKKGTLTLVFSCGFCKFFKHNFFIEYLHWVLLDWMNFRYTTKYLKFNVLFKLFDKAWLFRKQWYIYFKPFE